MTEGNDKELPSEFSARMLGQLGAEAEAFFQALAGTSPASIRLHHLKGRSSFDLSDRVPWCRNGYYLPSRPSFHLDPHWHGGAYYVQEASSMILDHVLGNVLKKNQPRIWVDLCAAPGGKTGILASHMGPDDVLLANEVVGTRRAILRENLTKAGYHNTFIAGESSASFKEPFADVMLIDAPCAGEGMMRKDPEAIRQWTPSLVQQCSALQRQLVSESIMSLREEGYLVYSTCSYSYEENLNNVIHFASTYGLHSVRIDFPESWGIHTLNQNGIEGYQLYPHRLRGEGLFIAVLQKPSVSEPIYQKTKKPTLAFESLPAWLAESVSEPDRYRVRKNSISHQIIRASAEAKANELLTMLPRAELIGEAGERKGKDFIPSHFMAMSGMAHAHFGLINAELAVALDYLQRATDSLPADGTAGWHLVAYQETILGWVKRTAQGWKNHYPMNWRLRNR